MADPNNKRQINCVIFDLDGVLVSTDELHYQSWQKIANEEGIFFNREINQRLRGISRAESLKVLLEKAEKNYSEEEKHAIMTRKNQYFVDQLIHLNHEDTLPGVIPLLCELRKRKIKIGVGSSSKNARLIMNHIGLNDYVDAIIDGTDITHSKPHPEVFLRVAQELSVASETCIVIEDAQAGVEAAQTAGMAVFGIDPHHILTVQNKSDSLVGITAAKLLNV